ncbi:MAG TPA: hypothetical protein ENH10_04850, partial [Bacteroidetes bacterium]|nr:hypothetical protein [Bacteroidota bacterium]HEX04470.1 hypothetical protein [Bacteroidota bacterium]
MRVAIVLTVSKYTGAAQDLPVFEEAADAVNTILGFNENFDQVLTIDSSSNSADVKDQIREFVSSLKGEKISEFFFYFTGIGQLDDLGYYYLLSDYEESKLLQTSLHNSELDLLIKSLSPELFVKIVDATYSGVHYVKEIETTHKVIERS